MSKKSKLNLAVVALLAAAGGVAATTVAFERGWMESFLPGGTPAVADKPSRMNGSRNAAQTVAAAPGDQGTGGRQLYHCGMHPWIIMDHPGTCPICHMALTPIQGSAQIQTAASEKKILYYWDPMLGPSSISDKPGKSAMGMDLVPVYENEVSAGPEVVIDPAVVQNMGVQTAQVMRGPMAKTVRTVGILDLPEPGLHDISLKINGWIDKLYADTTGMHIHKGDPLFDLYSPDLVVAQEELIAAEKSLNGLDAAASPEIRQQAGQLVAAARRKLELWDIPDSQIDAIAKLDQAQRMITFRSPVTGHLHEKMIVQGAAVQAGTNILRIANHSIMWLDAKVYEEDLPLVELGQEAEAIVDGIPGKTFQGKITFISPHVEQMARTTDVRIELANPDFLLKPGMYATVLIHTHPVANTLWVPREAVIDTGTRQIVFVAGPAGHFSPRQVTMGLSGDDDRVEILKGLASGETVVTSGQFLLDVESRTDEAIQKLLSVQNDHAVAGHPMTMPGLKK